MSPPWNHFMIFKKCTLKIHAFWRITSNIQASGITTIFHSDTSHWLGSVPVHSVKKTYVLVVTVELIWLLFLNIVFPISFKRQTNILGLEDLEEAMYTTLLLFQPTIVKFALLFFCLMRDVQNCHSPFICGCLPLMIVHLHNLFFLSTPAAWMFLTPRWVRRQEIVK